MTAPKTIGANLAELTIRERAAAEWSVVAKAERLKAERAALNLAKSVFGHAEIVFDDFVPDEFAKRHFFEPKRLVTFAIEGLEFNYVAASKERSERFMLVDMCSCGRGPRLLASIWKLADLGRIVEWDYSNEKCQDCKDDEKKGSAS